MKPRLFTAAIAASIAFAGAAGAATLNGLFNVQVAQITGTISSQSEATAANFAAALAGSAKEYSHTTVRSTSARPTPTTAPRSHRDLRPALPAGFPALIRSSVPCR